MRPAIDLLLALLLLLPISARAAEDCDCPSQVRPIVGASRVATPRLFDLPSGFVALDAATDPHSGLPLRIRHSASGYEMALVPEGLYLVGAFDVLSPSNLFPQHVARITTFWIGVREVSRREYYARLGRAHPVTRPGEAMTGVTWREANTWCGRYGMRLPTEEEWEVAARGPNAAPYPWGETWDRTALLQRDLSAFEMRGMAGAPAEWCKDAFDGITSKRVVRGDFSSSAARAHGLATRRGVAPGRRDEEIGFRAVLVPVPVSTPTLAR